MGAGGRPKIYTEEKIKEIINKLEKYIEKTDIPIVAEFAYKNNIRRKTLYDIEGFSPTIRKLIDKKEAQLERKALESDINVTTAIFSLKQLGWKDRQEVTGKDDSPVFQLVLPKFDDEEN